MKIDWKELLVFQGSFKGVSRKFHGSLEEAPQKLQGRSEGVSSVSNVL